MFLIRIRKFLGLPDLELLVRDTDPDPYPSSINHLLFCDLFMTYLSKMMNFKCTVPTRTFKK